MTALPFASVRAGRQKYEQIAATACKVSGHPTVLQAREKAKNLLGSGSDTVTARLPDSEADATASLPATNGRPKSPRRPPSYPAAAAGDALA